MIRMVYIGRRLDTKGKVYNSFYVVGENGKPSSDERSYSRNSKAMRGTLLANPTVGGVYEVESEGTSITPSTAKFVQPLGDDRKTAQWEAEDHATRIELARRSAEKRYAEDLPLERAIERITYAYRRTAPSQRHGLLAYIVKRIASR
jgi:hypothetical protein